VSRAREACEAADVVILCGGRGTRLGPLTARVPKSLLPIGDDPFLAHLLMRLRREGFGRFVLAAHHLAEQFEAFVQAWRPLVQGLELATEPEALGTGGGLRRAAERVRSQTFVALNGDSVVDDAIAPALAAHQAAGRAMTLIAVRADRVIGGAKQKALLRIGPGDALRGVDTVAVAEGGWINGGVYVLERDAVRRWPAGAYSFEARMLELFAGREVGVWRAQGRLLDIGTPDCYADAMSTLGARAGASTARWAGVTVEGAA
jgi:D-glycero-D-manno-heptose 1,7-bisphosphate phosphatase